MGNFLVIYSKKFVQSTNKQNDLLASCVFINFVKKLDIDYFIRLQTPKKDWLNLIVKDITQTLNNSSMIHENMLFECIADMILILIFVNITKDLAEVHEDRRDKIEEKN